MTEPCTYKDQIMKHERELGEVSGSLSEIKAGVSYIRSKVDNGLSTKIADIEQGQILETAARQLETANRRSEDWLSRIVTGSVAKLIGIGVTVIILSALTNNGMALFIKDKLTKEPEQNKQILEKLDSVEATVINAAPVVLTTADIQAIKNQFIKEIRVEFDRQTKSNKFRGEAGKTGPVGQAGQTGQTGKKGASFWKE